jgi:hypothetical protein
MALSRVHLRLFFDADPDPAFDFRADPDPAFDFYAHLDPAAYLNADQHLDQLGSDTIYKLDLDLY